MGAFLEQGATVAALGRTASTLESATEGFQPDRVFIVPTDLAETGSASEAIAAAAKRFGRIDVVVANAGSSEPSHIHTFDPAVWERLRRINLDAMVELVDASVPHLRTTWGNFLAVSSNTGVRGGWGMFAYNATKAAFNVMMQSLALNLGADGVRVNAIAPGFTTSRLTAQRLEDPEYHARLMDRTALGRVAGPDDIR